MQTYTKEKIRDYYRGVRLSNASVIVFSVFLFVLGVLLYFFFKSPLSFGAIVAIYSFGFIQMGLSTFRFFRSFKEYKIAISKVEESNLKLKQYELPRLEKRNMKISWARKAEMLSLALFFGLCILAVILQNQDFLFGSSAILLIQLAVMLCYDLIRQYYIREYVRQLEKLG